MPVRARGQSLVITAMIMLVVVLMVFFTFSVGERTRRKMRMQALADSAAYSSAVAEARAMNFYALSNRAIVSHMVSALSVSAHSSWINWYEDALAGQSNNWLQIAGALHDHATADVACAPCSRNLLGAADAAFNIAEWYAFAMPTYGGQVALSGGNTISGLPLPWAPSSTPNAGTVFISPGGTPRRIPFPSGAGWSPRPRFDSGCYNLNKPGLPGDPVASSSGGGDADNCEARLAGVRGARGAQWMHRQYHAKVDGDWCSLLGMGRRAHFDVLQMIRGEQLDVERELVTLLRGSLPTDSRILRNPVPTEDLREWLFYERAPHVDTDPQEGNLDGTETPGGGGVDLYDADNQGPAVYATGVPLVQALAQKVDPHLIVTPESAKLTSDLYLASVVPQYAPGGPAGADPEDPNNFMSHRDFDQMVFVARFPQWIYQRRVDGFADHLLREANWTALNDGAVKLAAGRGTVTNIAQYHGQTKPLSVKNLPLGQMMSPWPPPILVYQPAHDIMDNSDMWWNAVGRSLTPPAMASVGYRDAITNDAIPDWYRRVPASGVALMAAMTDERPLSVFGMSWGHGTMDWGEVDAEFQVNTACAARCDDPIARTPQLQGRDGSWNRGDGFAPKGIHFFHGQGASVGHRMGSVNQSMDHSYPGHMRFHATDDADALWNMPRTVVMFTQPTTDLSHSTGGVAGRWPWDFDFSAPIFGQMNFKTIGGQGDVQANNVMAAASAGLIYYHQPTRWEEPPNLWNPFWRAKLHPITRDQLRQSGHAATTAQVAALPAGAINE